MAAAGDPTALAMSADLEDQDSFDEDEFEQERPAKRAKVSAGGFSDVSLEGPSAESQLEAMLAAETFPGMPKGKGKGKGMDLSDVKGLGKGLGADNTSVNPNEPRVETTPMDFSRLSRELPSREVPVPKVLVEHLMTPEHRMLLTEQSGADVEWAPEEAQVKVRGSAEQVKRASRLLQRVLMHCHWGRSVEKVRRLLKPRIVESAICRLSPMNTLRPAQKLLAATSPILSIGKDKQNDVVIQDPIISRQHCILELDSERGAVYAIDCSTNGTFLNGIRLPSKQVGKVLLSHGDELLFKDPSKGEQEFGYIVNLNELHVKSEVKLEAPRRLLTPEEMANAGRDFA